MSSNPVSVVQYVDRHECNLDRVSITLLVTETPDNIPEFLNLIYNRLSITILLLECEIVFQT